MQYSRDTSIYYYQPVPKHWNLKVHSWQSNWEDFAWPVSFSLQLNSKLSECKNCNWKSFSVIEEETFFFEEIIYLSLWYNKLITSYTRVLNKALFASRKTEWCLNKHFSKQCCFQKIISQKSTVWDAKCFMIRMIIYNPAKLV